MNIDESQYVLVADLPQWFAEKGNRLFVPKEGQQLIPHLLQHGDPFSGPSNATLFLNGASDYTVILWGSGGTLYVAPSAKLKDSRISLGNGSIHIGEKVRTSARLVLNCRNGGSIVLKDDQLISSDVKLMTDDCHTLIDAETNKRINPYGGKIEIESHVWIGEGVTIMGNTHIGAHNVIGAGAFVRNIETASNVVIAGSPAKIVKTGVSWLPEDRP